MDLRCGLAPGVAEMEDSQEVVKQLKRGYQTVVIAPMSHPGLHCVRPLTVFGYDDAPHGHAEVLINNVELDEPALTIGEGRGFEIPQSHLGSGRIPLYEGSGTDCKLRRADAG